MLRSVREKLRLRRSRRHDAPPTSTTGAPGAYAATTALSASTLDLAPTLTPHQAAASQVAHRLLQSQRPDLPDKSLAPLAPPPHALPPPQPTALATNTSSSDTPHTPRTPSTPATHASDDQPRQPRVFRNRSLEYAAQRRDRQFLAIITDKARRTLHRGSRPASQSERRAARDRPSDAAASLDAARASAADASRTRNDDSFSSLPSTHASRDPFLNDEVPIDISRVQAREDRPRRRSTRDADDHGFQRPPDGRAPSADMHSPPASFSSASTSRKRSSLWKRKYDPESEFHTTHERDILKAVALSELSIKESNVRAAQQLAAIVDAQVAEIDVVLADVDKRVEEAQRVAANLPSTRDARFEHYLQQVDDEVEPDVSPGRAESQRSNVDLQWTERVWDIEALLAEKRFEDAVTSIVRLREDGVSSALSIRAYSKFQSLVLQLVAEMSSQCAHGVGDAPLIFAPLLEKLGMSDHARQAVLECARSELLNELNYITATNNEFTPRSISVILDKAVSVFRQARVVYTTISSDLSHDSSSFVAWLIDLSDKVYTEFVSPLLSKMKKADPVTILAAIEATRHRRLHRNGPMEKDERSLISLVETRITTHVRKELDGPIRDAERQLMERARMYASAIPRNWREGPYQSGKAVCDELNVLSRGLEGALMNLGTEADMLTGNLLARPALTYCITLLEMGTKAVSDDERLSTADVQEGIFGTFVIIGKTMMRLHQRFPRIPMLERTATVLMSPNLGEVRILHAEVFARRSSAGCQLQLGKAGTRLRDEQLSRTLRI